MNIHPIYTDYKYDVDNNEIVHIPTNTVIKQRQMPNGYCTVSVKKDDKWTNTLAHRFIWSCCNDIIPIKYEVDHIDHDPSNNNISNLRLVTIQTNRKHRNHTNIKMNAKIAHTLKRFIKAINIDTDEYNYFKSKYQTGIYFNISPAMIYLICSNKNYAKYANTKKYGKIKFEYADEKDVIFDKLIVIPHGRLGKIYKIKMV